MGPDIDAFEALPELPPANFDFLIYSLRLQTQLSLGLLPFGPPRADGTGEDEGGLDLDNSVTHLRAHFKALQISFFHPA